MPYLIGTDEAGYGPNLGPLVVSATVWRVDTLPTCASPAEAPPTAPPNWDPYECLADAICLPGEESDGRVPIGDSKALFKPGKGLAGLERSVLASLGVLGTRPRCWRSIWKQLGADPVGSLDCLPWYCEFDLPLPIAGPYEDLAQAVQQWRQAEQSAGCELHRIESRAIFPNHFNELVVELGNKAATLSRVTLELVADLLAQLPSDEPVFILGDKHGGRNKYAPLLAEIFPDSFAWVRHEGREESAYVLGEGVQRRDFIFRAKGESFLPSALASMVSKYLRELAMHAFNQFWTTRVDDLRPTAGYPVDAKRFKREIAHVQQRMHIADATLWRSR